MREEDILVRSKVPHSISRKRNSIFCLFLFTRSTIPNTLHERPLHTRRSGGTSGTTGATERFSGLGTLDYRCKLHLPQGGFLQRRPLWTLRHRQRRYQNRAHQREPERSQGDRRSHHVFTQLTVPLFVRQQQPHLFTKHPDFSNCARPRSGQPSTGMKPCLVGKAHQRRRFDSREKRAFLVGNYNTTIGVLRVTGYWSVAVRERRW